MPLLANDDGEGVPPRNLEQLGAETGDPATLESPPMAKSKRPLLTEQELAEAGPPEAVRIPLDLVDANPNNPRGALAEIDLLADNIKTFGLLQPVTVRRSGKRYELLGGHRRRAAFSLLREREPTEAQWRTIPAVVRTADDEQSYLMLLSSQLHSRQWRPREEATALERLAETRTLREVAALVNRGKAWVSKRLRVYADSVLSGYVQSGQLETSVAEELLRVKSATHRRDMADEAVRESWTQAQAKTAVRRLSQDSQLRDIAQRARELAEILSTIDPSKLPQESIRDLWTLYGRIEVLSGRSPAAATPRPRRQPTIEDAERAAGVRQNAPRRRPGAPPKRKPGYKPRPDALPK